MRNLKLNRSCYGKGMLLTVAILAIFIWPTIVFGQEQTYEGKVRKISALYKSNNNIIIFIVDLDEIKDKKFILLAEKVKELSFEKLLNEFGPIPIQVQNVILSIEKSSYYGKKLKLKAKKEMIRTSGGKQVENDYVVKSVQWIK